MFKTKPVTSTSATAKFGYGAVWTARDFIVHSTQSTADADDFACATTLIRPWNVDWTFSTGATADGFFAMPDSYSAIRGRGGFGTGAAN